MQRSRQPVEVSYIFVNGRAAQQTIQVNITEERHETVDLGPLPKGSDWHENTDSANGSDKVDPDEAV